MSEPRLITPLLANHIMGEPISDHHGIRCCPAMLKDSDRKYIVKIISIPASPKQLDALLLSGAYPSKEAALRYFKELADDTLGDARLLQKLSRLEGFRAYDSWQLEPMEDGTGYDVYLLSEYGNTLERFLRRGALTHLAAVNLGLDLCAALSVCRRNGYLYVDLKPENIFISESKGYLIGDLGFLSLRSLKYAYLPDKYRSAYTPPEIKDAYSALNSTLDIYAAGLILYQVFNGGQLPKPDEPLAPPHYADYEMAEIIRKACAENPDDRWQDPQQMGQALASYLQRNTVNDTPIVPPVIPIPAEPEEEEEPIEVEETEENIPEVPVPMEELPEENPSAEEPMEEPEEAAPPVDAPVEESEQPDEEPEAPEPSPEEPAEEEPAEEEPEQFVIDGFLFDETLPDEDSVEELADTAISEEVSQMLAQADELIAHKAPDPVVAPEPIEIPMPEPILPEPEPEPEPEEPPAEEAPSGEPPEESEAPETEPEEEEEEDADAEEALPPPKPKRKLGGLIAALVVILLVLLLGLGGKYYYDNYYLQNITSISLDGAEDWLTVTLHTDIDNSLLTVICTDTYGNRLTKKVENNQATFTSLPSGASYKITVEIEGFHQLTGKTTATYTTATQTAIVGLTAIAGDTDGSVILSFSVQGPDSEVWYVKYSADGVAEQTAQCTGHMANITGLEVGKTYTFRLVPQEELYVVSGDTLEFTATAVIFPQNLTIHGFVEGALKATWEVPEGTSTDSWTVRCYNDTGYDTTFTVTEPSVSISGLDISQSYTLDVKASGMTVSRWASISAASITFKEILLDSATPGTLAITWPYEGTAPEGGWLLQYTVDGSEPVSVLCEKNTCVLNSLVPGGHYSFSFDLPEDITVFGGTAEYDAPEVQMYSGYNVTAENMRLRMCRAPQLPDWSHTDVAEEDYTYDFAAGESAGFVIYLNAEYETAPDPIEVKFILRNQDGILLRIDTFASTWMELWHGGYCELDLPTLPADPGSYSVEIYFNGSYITAEPIVFTVS